METPNFNPNESLKTIETALKQARSEKTGARYYYLVWGFLLAIHFFLQYIITHYPEINGGVLQTLVWLVFPVGGLLSYLRSRKDDQNEKVVPLYEKIYQYAFSGFALAYAVMFFASAVRQPLFINPLFALLLGLTVFVVGGITKRRPSMIGGIIGIICAAVSINVSLELQYLLSAIAAIAVCVMPGFLMKNSNV